MTKENDSLSTEAAPDENVDRYTVTSFGDEWSFFNQSSVSNDEHQKDFETYFIIFPWNDLPQNARGFDMGCGSGRWAKSVAPRVGHLHCVNPSNEAIAVAKKICVAF